MPIEKTAKIWMDGKLVDWDDARIHVLTHTLHYGSGVFEGIRAYPTASGPAVFRLTDHMRRLLQSAHFFMMEVPFTLQELVDATKVAALHAGYDEAILLNSHGFVAECTGENIFVVKDGALVTPPLSSGALEGVTRDSVMTIARDLGYEVREENLLRTDMYCAEE